MSVVAIRSVRREKRHFDRYHAAEAIDAANSIGGHCGIESVGGFRKAEDLNHVVTNGKTTTGSCFTRQLFGFAVAGLSYATNRNRPCPLPAISQRRPKTSPLIESSDQKLRTSNTHSNTASNPHATDHAIRSLRYFIAAVYRATLRDVASAFPICRKLLVLQPFLRLAIGGSQVSIYVPARNTPIATKLIEAMKTKRKKNRLYSKDQPRMPKPVSAKHDKGFSLRMIESADGRFAVVKEMRRRLEQLESDVNADSEPKKWLAGRAVFLVSFLESQEHDALNGTAIDFKRYLSATKSLSDLLGKLGLDKEERSAKRLTEYLEESHGRKRKRK